MRLLTKKEEQVMAFERQQMLYALQSKDAIITNLKKTIENKDETINLLKDSSKNLKKTIENKDKIINLIKDSTKVDELTLKSLADEIMALRKENMELKFLIPSEFPVEKIMRDCAIAAWVGEPSTRTFQSVDGKVQLLFEGTIYEPSYEEFSSDCNVFVVDEEGEKKPLYTIDSRSAGPYQKEVVTTGSKEDVREYLLYNDISFKEVL